MGFTKEQKTDGGHAGQRSGSERKKRVKTLKASADKAEADRLGISIPRLRQQRQSEVNTAAAKSQFGRAHVPRPVETGSWLSWSPYR